MASTKNPTKKLREKTLAELKDHSVKLKRDMFDLNYQHATRQLENTASLAETRRELARTLTVLGEKKLLENG
ncbi:MAG: 50S ribosomal protein L29 [Pseudomonadota bacterium]